MARALSPRQAFLLGLVLLLGLALGAAALFTIGTRHWLGNNAFHVAVGFDDIGGVEVGTRVRIQGIDAGEVVAIEPPTKAGQPVQLRLCLAGGLRHLVAEDARVQITSEGMLSGKVVRLMPGRSTKIVADGGQLTPHSEPSVMEGLAQASRKLDRVLDGIDSTLRDLNNGTGPTGKLASDLTQASAKLNVVLARADRALGALEQGQGTLGQLMQNDSLYNELNDTIGQVKGALKDVRSGDGTLGQLVKNADAYNETMKSLGDVRKMVASVKQNSDAIKSMPLVRNYVVDAHKELVRPDCKRTRKWFAESELFESGQAILTAHGRQVLDGAAPWMNAQNGNGSEVVIASFASPSYDADFAQTLTQKQSEVVADYLRNNHRVHRTGYWWWSTRTVKSVGCGNNPPPVPGNETLPDARIELLVFVPQS